MAGIRMNLWSLTLNAGERYPLFVRRDFVITNAALGEDATGEARSTVKVTHNPINPALFDDESDDEFDESFEPSDEDEDEDEEKIEADAAEDADEDEDDDEDSDDDEEELEETSVLCSLIPTKIEQAQLNLTFVEGEVVIFEVTGNNTVHLMGNYIHQIDEDSEYDSEEDDYSDLYDEDDEVDIDELSDDEEEEETKIVELPEAKPVKAAAAKPAAAEPKAAPKRKAEAVAEESPAKPTEALSKNQLKKLNKKARVSEGSAAGTPAPAAAAPKKEEPKKEAKKEKKRVLAGGLVVEDVTVGDGPVAKPGKRLGMRYIGKLESGKQFDANTAGKPFSFVLGRGEVIKGWDQGLVGMAVGGERRLTIPAALAYGNQKIPGIPPRSTLKFDVKLVSVN
ncbi:peptidylprolyl isomerase fpr3 [Cryptotrichosporon argae]